MTSLLQPGAHHIEAIKALATCLVILALAGCSAASPAPAPSPQVAQLSPTAPPSATRAASPTATSSPTSTHTPTVTRTPTASATRTATATATATTTPTRRPTSPPTFTPRPTQPTVPPSATPVPQVAGRYPQNSCVTYENHLHGQGRLILDWCIMWVELHPDNMEFHMSWHATLIEGFNFVNKGSDRESTTMYLIDEQGQRYPIVDINGAAGYAQMLVGTVLEGSYFFPLPMNGARHFDFYDEDQNPDVIVTAQLP